MEEEQRLQKAIEKRDRLKTEVDKLKGRLEEAQERKKQIEEKCKSKNIDPSKLEELVTKVTEKYKAALASFETAIESLEQELLKFERKS
jgi:phage shock protein A